MKAVKEEAVSAKIPISTELAKHLEDYPLLAFEQMISKAMSLQVLYGWSTEAAVREVMKEVPA